MKRVPNSGLMTAQASEIKCHPNNPRQGDLTSITASILANGFYGALLVQRSTNYIIAGNHRFQAGCQLGMTEFPAIFLDVTDLQAKTIMLADNRTNDIAGYDEERLCDLLKIVNDESGLQGTGYSDDDLAQLIKACDTDRPDEKPERQIKAADAKFNFVHVEFIVPRDEYIAWLDQLRHSVGFTKTEITKEILCRLGL